MNAKVRTKSELGPTRGHFGEPVSDRHAEKNPLRRSFTPLAAALLFVFATGLLSPFESAGAGIESLASGEPGQAGRMTMQSDEFGAFGNCSPWREIRFVPDSDTRGREWQCAGGLMLTHGNDQQWLFNDQLWFWPGNTISESRVVSDTVDDTGTFRASKFLMDLVDLEVDLVQETPTSGYNFVQTYTFTNTGEEPVSLGAVWFNDQDLVFEQTPFDNRVGFVPGDVPRVYFIESSDVVGADDPGIGDRDRRISVATEMSDGVTFDGYLGATPTGGQQGALFLAGYLTDSLGILEKDLNTIQELKFGVNGADAAPNGVNLDTDGDGLIDSPGDVSAAMQFSMDIPVGGSASLAFDYIGGNLSNASFDIAGLLAGDFNADGILDVVDLDVLTGEILAGTTDLQYDLDKSGAVDGDDRSFWVTNLKETYFGDTDLDGQVNAIDLNTFALNWQRDDATSWAEADFNGDGNVNALDLNVLALNWRSGVTQAASSAAVPEPSSIALLLLGGLALVRTARRHVG